MNTIKFSHNWNGKLNQKVFTTIRNHTSDKYKYYNNSIGGAFNVFLAGSGDIKQSILLKAEMVLYYDIPFGLIAIDTGITDEDKAFELFKKFGLKDATSWVIILTFGPVTKEQ